MPYKNQATQKQLDYLFKLGVKVEGEITKEVASDLIADELARLKNESDYEEEDSDLSEQERTWPYRSPFDDWN